MTSTPQELLDECAKELRYAAQYAMDHNVNLSGARAMARRVEEFLASFPLSETVPIVCYAPCKQHEGLSWTMTVNIGGAIKTVCPICEPPK